MENIDVTAVSKEEIEQIGRKKQRYKKEHFPTMDKDLSQEMEKAH